VNFCFRLPSCLGRNVSLVAAQNDAMAQGAKDALERTLYHEQGGRWLNHTCRIKSQEACSEQVWSESDEGTLG